MRQKTITVINEFDETVTFQVGEWVGFKSDVEQAGKIIAIEDGILTLENNGKFDGGYIGGDTVTREYAKRCWKEG